MVFRFSSLARSIVVPLSLDGGGDGGDQTLLALAAAAAHGVALVHLGGAAQLLYRRRGRGIASQGCGGEGNRHARYNET